MPSDPQRRGAALAVLQSALDAGPDPARLRLAALARAAGGDLAGAIALARQAAALAPRDAAMLLTLASLLLEAQRPAEAEPLLAQATLVAPDDAACWHHRGRALHGIDRLDQAIAAQRCALAIDPNYRDAWRWLGFSREWNGDLAGAAEAYQRALALRHEPRTALHAALLGPRYATDMAQLDWARRRLAPALAALAESGFTTDQPHRLVSAVTGFYAYWGGEDLPLHRAFARFWRRVSPALTWTAPHVATWRPLPADGRKPRIAYVTRYIYQQTVDRMFGGIARNLPRLGFDMRVFSPYAEPSPQRDEIERRTGPIVTLPGDLAEARRLIADFAPDAVIYPELGLHPFTYFLAFARLAPLQITTWGHAATSGLDSIDVFLGSSLLDPPGAERFYSEELVRLDPPPVSYRPQFERATRADRAALGLPPEARLYVCTQSLLKLQPDFDALLARLLARDPQGLAVIVGQLSHQSPGILRRRLAAAIPDFAERVRLIERLPDTQFAQLLSTADAVLDSLHFAGGSTAYDLVSLGVPFVTLPGPSSKGRVGYMLYRSLGIEDLIARDPDHYVELALRLARDRPWRQSLSDRLLAAAPLLLDYEPGYRALAQWLHGRLSQPRR